MKIHSWWPLDPKPGNFGDIMTPYLVKKMTDSDPHHSPIQTLAAKPNNLLAVGSIIKFAAPNMNIWGSGLMRMADSPSKNAVYHAVRGPLTRERVIELGGECPEIYGDPALLLPHFYTPKNKNKKYRFGITPHYVDYELVQSWYKDDPDIKIINLLNANIEHVIDQISECENIISSSLHGIIAAHAYGTNAHWVKFSDKLRGDGTKFRDYFASVGIEMEQEIIVKKMSHSDIATRPYVGNITYDGGKLMGAFPYAKR